MLKKKLRKMQRIPIFFFTKNPRSPSSPHNPPPFPPPTGGLEGPPSTPEGTCRTGTGMSAYRPGLLIPPGSKILTGSKLFTDYKILTGFTGITTL